ncbi:hypothetical protein LJR225_003124 [Phenylobacterium sp. LjRoot225]
MHAANAVDEGLGFGLVAIGGASDELRGALQASGHVAPKVGMVPHARERAGVQHLDEQGGDPADHHAREVAVHLPARAFGTEEACVLPIALNRVVARAADELAHLEHDRLADRRWHG